MNADEARRELEAMLIREDAQERRRLLLRLTGHAVLLAALAVTVWVAVNY